MRKVLAWIGCLIVLSGVIFPAPMAFAAKNTGEVRLKVTVLKASNEGKDFNFENDAFRDQLVKLFSYSSYQQIDAKVVSLKKTERVTVELPENYELMLTFQGMEDARAMIQALIRKGVTQYVYTVLAIDNPGVVFVGGPPVGNGVLVIVLETGF